MNAADGENGMTAVTEVKKSREKKRAIAENWRMALSTFVLAVIAVTAHVAPQIDLPFLRFIDEAGPELSAIAYLAGLAASAMFAAMITYNIVDRRFQKAEERRIEAFKGELARDVFGAIFSSNLNRNYVEEAIRRTLITDIYRKNYALDYTIYRLSDREPEFFSPDVARHEGIKAAIEAGEEAFLAMRVRGSFTLVNTTNQTISPELKCTIPQRTGDLAVLANLTKLLVGGRAYQDDQFDLEKLVKSDPEEDEKRYNYTVEIAPHSSVDVVTEYAIVKEEEDNEVWASFYPTAGCRLTAGIRVPGLDFGIRCNSGAGIVRNHKTGTDGNWTVDGPMLPYDSLIFWWRKMQA